MVKRRKLLIGIGSVSSSIVIAGCSGQEGPGDQQGDENTENEGSSGTTSEEEGEAVFEITSIVEERTYSEGEQVPAGGVITNTGDAAGEQTVEFVVKGEVTEGTVELEPGEDTEFGHTWEDASEFEPGTYEYSIRTEDDEATSTFTIEDPEEDSTSDTRYQVRISYDGEWSGSIGGDGSSRTVDGSGTETFDIDGDPFIVSANAQKQDDSSDELTVEILEDGEVIASESTTSSYGLAQVTSEDGTSSDGDSGSGSDGTGSTFEVRIEYDGEWQGNIGSDGSSRSVDGSGTETFEVDGNPTTISANAQKQDDSSNKLVIQILEEGEVVKESSTSAEYGVAQVVYSNY